MFFLAGKSGAFVP